MPASTSTLGRLMQEIARLDGVPPNMSVRMATPSPVSTRLTASMMSLRHRSESSSAPIVTASICFCGPMTCSSAALNSSARRPWVTSTRPIIENSSRVLLGAPHERATLTIQSPRARGDAVRFSRKLGGSGREPAPVYSVAIVGLIWLPIPFEQSAEVRREDELAVIVRAAITSGSAAKPTPTGIRGNSTPEISVMERLRRRQPLGVGGRQDRPPGRRRPRRRSQRRMPSPRISIRPASSRAGRTTSAAAACRDGRDRRRPARRRNCPARPARMRSKARRDLPAPEGPRISTARSRRPAPRRRARSRAGLASWRRQPHDEARAGNGRLRRRRPARTRAVLRPDASAMRLDDLLRDRQTESGILAESPDAAGRYRSARRSARSASGANARPVIVDHDLDLRAHAAAGDAHLAARPENERALDDQVGDHLSEPGVMAGHREACRRAAPSKRTSTATSLPRRVSLATEVSVVSSRRRSTGVMSCALQFGIEPAGVGNVGDQPVEPPDVVLDDGEQPRAAALVARQRQRLDRASAARSAGSSAHGRRRRRSVSIASMRL